VLLSQNTENKNFKQKNQLGQVFPVLLICIAALLAAVVVTRNIGNSNIAKTSASNAADAGSLAAASCWAGAFNRLIYRNNDKDQAGKEESMNLAAGTTTAGYTGRYMGYSTGLSNDYYYYRKMNKYYTEMKDLYGKVYASAKLYLTDKSNDNASYYCQKAIDELTKARKAVNDKPIVFCEEWKDPATGFLTNSGDQALESAECIGAFYVCTQYMQYIASWFKKHQIQNLCDAFTFMGEAYNRAKQTGQYYALSNSGYASNLTDAQADLFNFWLGGGSGYSGSGGSVFMPPSVGGSIGVVDGGVTYPPSPQEGQCSITVEVTVPQITKYIIKMAQWNFPQTHTFNEVVMLGCQPMASIIPTALSWAGEDPFTVASSKQLTLDMRAVSNYIKNKMYSKYGAPVESKTQEMVECCTKCDEPIQLTPCIPCTDQMTLYNEAVNLRQEYLDAIDCVLKWLTKINTLTGNSAAIPGFRDWHELIWVNVWPAAYNEGRLSPDILTCDQVKAYYDEAKDWPGMMVINIKDVVLDSGDWKTSCHVTSTCGATSDSKSKFHAGDNPGGDPGGLVGTFDDSYYPEITDITL